MSCDEEDTHKLCGPAHGRNDVGCIVAAVRRARQSGQDEDVVVGGEATRGQAKNDIKIVSFLPVLRIPYAGAKKWPSPVRGLRYMRDS